MPPSLNDDEGEVGSQPAAGVVMGIGGDGGGGGGAGAGQQVWVTRDGPDGKQDVIMLSPEQVWPLTQFFFCFLFVKNSLICLEGKSMTPHRGNTILFRSSQQLPHLRLVRCFRNYRDTRTPSGVPR